MRDSKGLMFNGLRGSACLLLLLVAALTSIVAFSAPANAQRGTFVIFVPPGCSRDISTAGINPAGAITGTCTILVNSNFVSFGFLRAPDGTFTIINVPGSTSTQVGDGAGEGGVVAGPPINPAGAVTGFYSDSSGTMHGFLRAPDSIFTTFDAPGAVNGTEFLCCITPTGAIVGISFDANFVGHGFIRAPNGTFTAFDPPGSTFTFPSGVNPEGAISGAYFDVSGVVHGFLRAPDGTITTFDVPGAVNGTAATGINPGGAITGFYVDVNFLSHGFLRAPDGTITAFDPPGSVAPFGTEPVAIDPRGAIVGNYDDGVMLHGFLRAADGTFTNVDPPGSVETIPSGINPAGNIAGSYGDANGVQHGFLFQTH
jgi:hypothetical protein